MNIYIFKIGFVLTIYLSIHFTSFFINSVDFGVFRDRLEDDQFIAFNRIREYVEKNLLRFHVNVDRLEFIFQGRFCFIRLNDISIQLIPSDYKTSMMIYFYFQSIFVLDYITYMTRYLAVGGYIVFSLIFE